MDAGRGILGARRNALSGNAMTTITAIPAVPAELGPQLAAFRGVPLSLSLALDRTRETLTGATALYAEIRQSVTDETPLPARREPGRLRWISRARRCTWTWAARNRGLIS